MTHPNCLHLRLLPCLGLLLCAATQAQAPMAAVPLTLAQAAALVGGPTLITLHVSGATVPQVFDAVIKQAGLMPVDTTHLGAAPGQTVTLDLDRVPFWKAVPLVAQQTHIGFAENGSRSDQTLLQPSFGGFDPMAGRVSAAGPFFVAAGSAQRSSMDSISYTNTGAGAPQDRQSLFFYLSLLVDPKIHLVPNTTRVTVLEATDENGKSLLETSPSESPVNTEARYVIGTGIKLASSAASRRIQRLRGAMHVTMVTKAETWEIANFETAAGAAKTIATADGPAQLALVSAQADGRGERATVTYKGPTLGLEFRSSSALLFGSLRVTDSQGNAALGFAGSVRGSGPNTDPAKTYTAEMSFAPRRPGALTPPLKLTWQLPVSVAPVDIPFEFTDLPLP